MTPFKIIRRELEKESEKLLDLYIKEKQERTIFRAGIYAEIMSLIDFKEKKYNNGWILCSEKLPVEPKPNVEFEGKPLELYLVSVEDEPYPFRAFWNGKNFTDGMSKLNVTAWQPLPSVYKNK